MKSSNSCGASAFSLATIAKNSSHDFVLRGSDKITSPVSGSFRIKTSFPSNRNSAGRRTAWLRPLRKSFAVFAAVVIIGSPPCRGIYHDISHLESCYSKTHDPSRPRHPLRYGRSPRQLPRLGRAQLDNLG